MTRGLGDEPGFTLVELLVVVLVLALLAAIAMPSFYGQRDTSNGLLAIAEALGDAGGLQQRAHDPFPVESSRLRTSEGNSPAGRNSMTRIIASPKISRRAASGSMSSRSNTASLRRRCSAQAGPSRRRRACSGCVGRL